MLTPRLRQCFVALCLLYSIIGAAGTAEAARHAFIVGNGAYAKAPALPNPSNDARDVAERLRAFGYKVTLGVDLTRAQFLLSFQNFVRSLAADDTALIYYAGHGLQIGGENYLFPVDAQVDSENDARTRLVSLNALISDLSRASKTRLVILDACRNNPFGDKLAQSQATRSAGLGQGLARVYAGVGSFIAYSTQPGNVALDGQGRNSPFSEALIRHMSEPGADVHAVMRKVRADVQRATGEQQVPWENSSLIDEMRFAEGIAIATAPAVSSGGNANAKPTPSVTSRGPVASESFAYVAGLDPNGDNFLALRSRPGSEGERLATMGPDTLLKIRESRGDWRRVELLDGTTGWAHGNWVQCCRSVAVNVRPSVPAAAAGESCDTLWRQRNAVWHRHGYCFTTAKGQQVFGNAGCSRNDAQARAAMTSADKAEVDHIIAREQARGCR